MDAQIFSSEQPQAESSPNLFRLAATGGLYFIAGMLGLAIPFTSGNISPIWPASGVALASLLIFGWRCWPAITAAAFLVNFCSHLPLLAALGLAVGNTAASLAALALLRRISGFRPSLSRLRDMLGLIVFAAFVSSIVSASFGCIVFGVLGINPWTSLGARWLMYYLGDAMGILLVAPLFLSLSGIARRYSHWKMVELLCLLLLLASTCILLFDEHIHFVSSHSVLTLLVFPFVLWAAIRFGILGAASANGVIAIVAVLETARGIGPFSKGLPFSNALLLQLFIATVAISGLLLAAVIAEQRNTEAERIKAVRERIAQKAAQESERLAEEQIRKSRAELQGILDNSPALIYMKDIIGRYVFVNRSWTELFHISDEMAQGKTDYELFTEEAAIQFATNDQQVLNSVHALDFEEEQTLEDGVHYYQSTKVALRDSNGRFYALCGISTDISERKRTVEALRQSEERLRITLEATKIGSWDWDLHNNIWCASPICYTMLGYEPIYGSDDRLHWLNRIHPEDLDTVAERTHRVLYQKAAEYRYEARMLHANGSYCWQEVIGCVVERDEEGNPTRLIGVHVNISERKQVEAALGQTHRALRVLSNCNSAVVHATAEQALLDEVCRVAVGPAGYELAWVGYAEQDIARTVRLIASAGPAEGFLDRVHVSWANDQYGQGAIGLAIRENRPVVVRDLLSSSQYSVWREFFEARKFRSILAIPLRQAGAAFGVLAIYANEPEAFDSAEVDLLAELGENLAHGIISLRARNERAEALAALERARLELEERVRERTSELEIAKEAAESADRLKSTFLATMSHELRTPLNSIIGFTGIVSQGMAGPLNAEQAKQLNIVKNSARHLLDLINDVLDISKIEAGQLESQCEIFSLPQAIDKIIAIISSLAEKKGIALCVEVSTDVGIILGDQRRTEQILLNLIGNAVKFTDEGSVSVRCWRESEWLAISIKDTGIGIDPEHQKSIFEPFRQVDTGLSRKREGTGLGLSICKRLVEHLGGILSMESIPGKGSTFTVQLPREWNNADE